MYHLAEVIRQENAVLLTGTPSEYTLEGQKLTPRSCRCRRLAAPLAAAAYQHRQLAESINTTGLQHPIDILPNGTILGGHNRLAAVRLLGWEEMPVRVRHDLAGKSDAELDQVFIEDNLNRRQMNPVQIARAYAALKGKCLPRDRAKHRGDLRDQLAKRFGKGGRMLDRYVRLL